MTISIQQVSNGYVVILPHVRKVFHELEEVFQALLGHFEGRYAGLQGEAYGVVIISRDAPEQKSHAGTGIVKNTQMRPLLTIPDDAETPAPDNLFFGQDDAPKKEA